MSHKDLKTRYSKPSSLSSQARSNSSFQQSLGVTESGIKLLCLHLSYTTSTCATLSKFLHSPSITFLIGKMGIMVVLTEQWNLIKMTRVDVLSTGVAHVTYSVIISHCHSVTFTPKWHQVLWILLWSVSSTTHHPQVYWRISDPLQPSPGQLQQFTLSSHF